MSLPHALLGLINYSPATGYDLNAAFKKSIYFFWSATLPQIYRTLSKMEENGWLSSNVEHQDGRPSRKVYSISEAGKKEFQRWLAEPPEKPSPRSPMLAKVFFGRHLSRDRLIGQITGWREYHARLLRKYEDEILPMIEKHSHRIGNPDDVRFWTLTLDYGRRQARMTVDWCDETLRAIEGVPKAEGDGSFSSRS
ncbi:MAG: PadR family transcriptional regulator [Syntrophorhabdales bacterium]|jgi:DNA-binding PadR family transcriptional regulator